MSPEDLAAAIWAWLPARADRTRVTIPASIAVGVGAPLTEVGRALARMEARGHAVRDRSTGHRADSWHRGRPLTATDVVDIPTETQEGLWD